MFLGFTLVVVIFVLIFVLHFAFSKLSFIPKQYSISHKLALNLAVGLIVAVGLIPFQEYLGMGDLEDASLDFAMQADNEIPPITAKAIPSFAFLDIDNQTYKLWEEPLYIPGTKIKELIAVAVNEKARLIIVDVDLSRNPDDKELKEYIAGYKDYCQEKTCPPIILDRAFRSLSDSLAAGKKPILVEPRTGFLEDAVVKSAPYIQWATPLFQESSYDGAVRRWKLWEHICTPKEEADVIPATQLLAAAMIRFDTPQPASDKINAELARFKRKVCGDEHIAKPTLAKPIKIAEGLEFTGGIHRVFQRIMYHLPWKPPQSIADEWVMRYSLRDSGNGDSPSKLILTVFSAQPYLDSQQTSAGNKLENKIVLISSSYSDGDNLHSTPLGNIPGGLVIINAIHSLLQYGEIQPPSNWYKLLWLVLLIVAVTFGFEFFKNSFLAIVISGVIIIALIPVTGYLFVDSYWISLVLPLLAVHVSQVVADYQQFKVQRQEFKVQRQDLENEVKQSLIKQIASAQLAKELTKGIEQSLTQQIDKVVVELPDAMSKSKKMATSLVGRKFSFAKEFVKSKLKKKADKSPDKADGSQPSEGENTSQSDNAIDISGLKSKKSPLETTPIQEETTETSEPPQKKGAKTGE